MSKLRRKVKIELLFLSGLLVSGMMFGAWQGSVRATNMSDVQNQINSTQNQINSTQNQLNNINEEINNLTDEQDLIEEKIADIKAEILNTMTSIGILEDEIAEKEVEIADKEAAIALTQEAYEEAEATAQKQQEDMMTHVRVMYESNTPSYLSMLLAGDGFRDVLNRLDYIEQLYDYDHTMLDKYIETQNQVRALWDQLEAEKAQLQADKDELEQAQAELEAQRNNLNVMLEQRQKESDDYEAEIKRARQEAAVAKAKLQQEQKELQRLQAEQKRLQNQQKPQTTAGTGSTTGNTGSTGASAGGGSGSAKGQEIADFACQFVGNPYVAGGTSLTEGADCSGFTYRVYQEFGYSIPRTSYGQRSAGTGVSYENAQPGDIICYEGHVAIYIGGGQIVHASTERSGIKISNANYRPILTVRRII